MSNIFTWERRHPNGYECSSVGDRRFSALFAKLEDGRTIEQHYQCDVKGYEVGGTDWRIGKGRPSLRHNSQEELYLDYFRLWEKWAYDNLDCMRDLYRVSKEYRILTDCFATTPINQARALADMLNILCEYP